MSVTVRIGTLLVDGKPDEAALRRAVEGALRQQAPQLHAAEPAITKAVTAHVARSIGR